MANWAWPHTPSSGLARLLLVGGPFDGTEAAFLPPDLAGPVQIVWSGWGPRGFVAVLHEWHGETRMDRGRTDALVFRPTRLVPMTEVPPLIAEDTEMWADTAALISETFAVPPEMLWPGV